MTPDELDNVLKYLRAHELSNPSYRYIFILWFIILGFGVLLGVERAFGILDRTIVGAMWTKWAARHRVIKVGSKSRELRARAAMSQPGAKALQATRRHVFTFMDLGRMTVLVLFTLVLLCLTFIGSDYINPSGAMFTSSSYPTSRDRNAAMLTAARRDVQWGRGDFGAITFKVPQFTLPYHTWWTVGDRTGDICNALTPFVVLIALKQTPFALAALPMFGGFSIDLLHYLHRWGGRTIWLYATAHAITWSVQLGQDKMNGHNLWHYMVDVPRFRWAWTAYAFLTLLVLLSLNIVRRKHYEVFYFIHVVCAIGFMVATWAHHPQLGWWMLAAFILWGGERLYRIVKVVLVNYAQAPKDGQSAASRSTTTLAQPSLGRTFGTGSSTSLFKDPHASYASEVDKSVLSLPASAPLTAQSSTGGMTPPIVPDSIRPVISWDLSQHLFPGFAFVQPLAGETLRLVLRTNHALRWKPGQWVYLRLPQLSWIQSHPFTIASVHCLRDEPQLPSSSFNNDQLLLLLIRARSGMTRRLWDYVLRACKEASSRAPEALERNHQNLRLSMFPALNGEHVQAHVNGVYLRSIVDGPFGSSARIDWGAYSTALVICGGSGVSFGISVLEHLCRQIARVRSGEVVKCRFGRSFNLRRVRFVWVLREFAHIQWVASTLRYCLELLPPDALRVQMFVTCINERQVRPVEELKPATPAMFGGRPESPAALDPENPQEMAPTAAALFTSGQEWNDLDLTVNDMTQFDEERDHVSPLDRTMNERIMRQGKLRRAKTRRRQTQKRNGDVARRRIAERRESHAAKLRHEEQVGWQSHADQEAELELQDQHELPPLPLEPAHRQDSGPPPLEPVPSEAATHESHLVETPAAVYEAPLNDYFSLPRSDYAPVTTKPEMIPLDTIKSGAPASELPSRPGTSGSHASSDHGHWRSNTVNPTVNLEPLEARDLEIISELARAGYPKLDEIIAEEMHSAQGRVIAAGCGPPGLSALIRSVVSRTVDVSKVWHGDLSGHATIYTESFES